MRMDKKKFRIGQLAKELAVEGSVIRFWEKEFGVSSLRSVGGQRFYDCNDLEKFKYIKRLLYELGYTISGAKKILEASHQEIRGSHKTTFAPTDKHEGQRRILLDQIFLLRKQLLKLRALL